MPRFGYKLMSEEHGPAELVRNAVRAEAAGFDFVALSDHYHPWLDSQGHSSFAWTVLGAIAAQTTRVGLMTAVTCPTVRYHPTIVAQAAATVAVLSNGRFTLGLGSGELLNEHVVGEEWPSPKLRQDMLEEAVEIIRLLWQGGTQSFEGDFYEVDRARVWDLPAQPPPIVIAAGGKRAARIAAESGDGIIATEPDPKLISAWRQAGGKGPRYAEVGLCWAEDEQAAVEMAHDRFRFGTLGWKVMNELANPENFEAATRWVRPEDVARGIACGPDPDRHVSAVKRFIDAGFDHLILTGVGPDQEGFVRFWSDELQPRLRALG